MNATQFINLCALAGVVLVAKAEASVYSDTVLADNPVAYWRLGESSGTTAVSQTNAPANNGTYSLGFTLGQPGALPYDPDTAVKFDGGTTVNECCGENAGHMSASLATLGSTYSYEGWFNYNISPSFRLLVGTVAGRGTGSAFDAVEIWGSSDASTKGKVFVHNGSSTITGTQVTTSNVWYYMAFTRTGSSVNVYLRGLNGQSENISGTLSPTFTTTAFQVGQRNDNFWGFPGRIDEVAVYDYALTQSQADLHFAAASIPEPASLMLIGLGGMAALVRRRV
jgi:hypothetical protein